MAATRRKPARWERDRLSKEIRRPTNCFENNLSPVVLQATKVARHLGVTATTARALAPLVSGGTRR